jgi:hypothetical protein
MDDIVLDVRGGSEKSIKLLDWCHKNLNEDEYDTTVMAMFPLWYRFHFNCPKTKLLAILST